MSYADQEFKSSTKFLKIEQGQPMVIRLLDVEPVEIMKHQGKIMMPCKGEDLCPLCQEGDEPVQKRITNIYNHTLKKVQLFEFGPAIGKLIKKIAVNLAEEGKDIMEFDLKLEAEGAGLSKKYAVTLRTAPLTVPPGLVKLKIDGDIPF